MNILANSSVCTDRALKTQQNQVDSPLLRLPAELRNRIYDLVFANSTLKIHYRTYAFPESSDQPRYQRVFDVLVCRQTHFEAFSAFYKHCAFKVHPYNLDLTTQAVDLDACANIRAIELPCSATWTLRTGWHRLLDMKRFCDVFPSLVHVHAHWIGSDEGLKKAVTGLRKIFGDGKLGFMITVYRHCSVNESETR